MAKQEVYWFHHDGNARRDIKILTMRLVYGAEGYGWWWMLLEMMREATDYKLRISGKYDIKTIAQELGADPGRLKEYLDDCVQDFGLFQSDGDFLWSPAFLRRMDRYDEIVEKRREAARRSHDNR